MKFNESLLKSKIKENLKGIENNLDREGKATAIAEALNFFDSKRDWVTKINRDEIISLITNSPSQDELCESIIDRVNATPFSKSLKESKKKKESKKLNESLTKSLNEQKLEEGTSNFYNHNYLPLLVFMLDEEIEDQMNYSQDDFPNPDDFESWDDYLDAMDDYKDNYYDKYYKDVCVLNEYDLDQLKADLLDFNGETKNFDYEDGEDTWTLEDIELVIKSGYYEGYQIYCENEKNFDYLSDGVKEEQLNRFNTFLDEMQKKYGLTKLSVAYRMSNGETGYNIQEELKNIKEAKDDLQTKATKMMSVKKYYIDMAWKNGKTWKTDPMTLDEIAKSVDMDKVTEQQFVDSMAYEIKRRKDAKNLTKAEIVKLYDYMDGKWQGKDVLWSIKGKTNESLDDTQKLIDNAKKFAKENNKDVKVKGLVNSNECTIDTFPEDFNEMVKLFNTKFDVYDEDSELERFKIKAKSTNESLEQYHYARVLKKLAGRTITEHDLDACAKELGMDGYRLWNVLKALVDDMYITNGEKYGEEYFKIPENAYDELPSELKESKKNLKEGFRGCKKVEMIWHGSQSDPELSYTDENGKEYRANYWDIEDAVYEHYKEEHDYATNNDDEYAKSLNATYDWSSLDGNSDDDFNKFVMDREDDIINDIIEYNSVDESCGKDKKRTKQKVKEHISSKDLKDNDILDILGIEEEQRKVKNVGSYIKQYRQLLDKGYDEPKFEIYLNGDDAYYKKLGKVVDNSKDLVVIDTNSKEENLKEGYYDYMDKDYAHILDSDVDVYDVNAYILKDSNNKFKAHYTDEYAIITAPNGKGCVVDYEAVGQDFDTLDSEIEFGIEENKDSEYTDENGKTHKTIRIFASHILTTTPKEVMEKAPKKTMKYRDFFRKYKYNDRCADNFAELVSYIKKNGGLQEGCHSKKKRTLKEGYLGQTLEDFFYDCVDPEVIGTVSLWGDNDEIYSGDYDGAIDEYGSNEFIEFDCGTGKVVINVDTSEEYQVTDYFIDVQDFVDCFNGDDIEVYDINTGETLFSGDRSELPDDVAEKIFVSFDAPDFISINIEEDGDRFDDDDDFDESLNEEALGKVQEVTRAVDCDGNEFYVKPIWRGDRLAKLVDKDGNQTRVEIADLRQYYDLYDQDGDVISRYGDYMDESLKEDRVYKDYVIEYNKPYNYYIIRTQGGSVVGYINGTKAKNRKDIETIIDNGSYEKSDDYIKNENLKEDWVKHFKNFDYYPNEDENKFIVIKTDGNGKTLDKFEIDVTTYEDAKKYIKDNLLEKVVNEDTVKQGGKWVNKGNTGKTHGEFKTKKEADKQRKAMFVNKKPNAKWGK